MSSSARRELIREYKERKIRRGIYAVRCTSSGQVWVASAVNLDAAWNSLRFQLNAAHRNTALQAAWRQYGEAAFTFEVLEVLEDDIAELMLHDTLKTRRAAWAAELSAECV